jgi:large subunit ribosomal protein L10
MIITQEQLKIDVGATRKTVESAHAEAFALSLSVAYPTTESMTALLQVAHREAYALSLGAAVPTKESIEDLVRKAHAEMLSLSSRVPTVEEKAKPPPEKTEKG